MCDVTSFKKAELHVGTSVLTDRREFPLYSEERNDAQSSRGRSQDRRRVDGGQDYEVRYEAKKTGSSKKQVKKAIHKVGNSRRKVEKQLD